MRTPKSINCRASRLTLKGDDPTKGKINLKEGTQGRNKGKHEKDWVSANCKKGRHRLCYCLGCSCNHHKGIQREYQKRMP